jgi:hypothetical protein
MIRVYDKQLGEIARLRGLERFEDDMVVHLRGFSPRHMEVIGEDWARRAIRLGIERAAAYGIVNPGLLRFYVELMVAYGSTFDVDPLYPWAGEILRDPAIPDAVSRMDRLYQAYVAYLAVVSDPERRSPFQAVKNLTQILREDLPPAELRDEQRFVATLARIYPQRCAYLGEPRLLALVRRGPEEAARQDVATDLGVAVVTGILFSMGPGFASDPLYPWIGATLRDPAIKTPEQRAERLKRRIQIYLERAIKYLERKRANVVL